MAGLVEELQRDALDTSVAVDDLLRKALVVSRKLALPDVQKWIEQELGGYGGEPTPDYRKVHGEPKMFNPFHGWQPLVSDDAEFHELLSTRCLAQSAGELQDLLRNVESSRFQMNYPADIAAMLMRSVGHDLQPTMFIARQQVVKALNAVRTRVLEWSLDLEEKGIHGSGLSFSRAEKVTASQVHYTTVNHIGSMHHSQLQQNSSGSQTIASSDIAPQLAAIVEAITKAMEMLSLSSEKQKELEAELATLKAQAGSPHPKVPIIRGGLQSIRTILEGAAGNLVASSFTPNLTQILSSLG